MLATPRWCLWTVGVYVSGQDALGREDHNGATLAVLYGSLCSGQTTTAGLDENPRLYCSSAQSGIRVHFVPLRERVDFIFSLSTFITTSTAFTPHDIVIVQISFSSTPLTVMFEVLDLKQSPGTFDTINQTQTTMSHMNDR